MVFWDGFREKVKERRQLAKNTRSNRSTKTVSIQLRESRKQLLREIVLDDVEDTYIEYNEVVRHIQADSEKSFERTASAMDGAAQAAAGSGRSETPSDGDEVMSPSQLARCLGEADAPATKRTTNVSFLPIVKVYRYNTCATESDLDIAGMNEENKSGVQNGVAETEHVTEENIVQGRYMQRMKSPTIGFWMRETMRVAIDEDSGAEGEEEEEEEERSDEVSEDDEDDGDDAKDDECGDGSRESDDEGSSD